MQSPWENLGVSVPISKERYKLLCEVGTHVTAETVPGAHNPLKMPLLGAHLQQAGVLVALNEVSIAVAMVALFSALYLRDLDQDVRTKLLSAVQALGEHIGGATIIEMTYFWEEVRNAPQFAEAEQFMKRMQRKLRETDDPEELREIVAKLRQLA